MIYKVETCRPHKYTILYKLKLCVIDGYIAVVCYSTSGLKASKLYRFTKFQYHDWNPKIM